MNCNFIRFSRGNIILIYNRIDLTPRRMLLLILMALAIAISIFPIAYARSNKTYLSFI